MNEFIWPPRARVIAISLAGLLVLALAVFVAASNRDDEIPRTEPSAGPSGSPGGPGDGTGTADPGQPSASVRPGLGSRRWPVDKAKAETVAGRFAVRFSTYLPTGPDSPKEYLDSLMPYATEDFLTIVQNQFDAYWWDLNRSGLGVGRADVRSVTTQWEKPDAIAYRVVVERQIRSYLGQSDRNRTDKVSWDLVVTSPTEGEPKVSSCVRTDTRPSAELSDPYEGDEAEGE